MNSFQQSLIVNQAHEKHRAHACENPIDLPDMGPGKLRVFGGTVDLEHAEAAQDVHLPINVRDLELSPGAARRLDGDFASACRQSLRGAYANCTMLNLDRWTLKFYEGVCEHHDTGTTCAEVGGGIRPRLHQVSGKHRRRLGNRTAVDPSRAVRIQH